VLVVIAIAELNKLWSELALVQCEFASYVSCKQAAIPFISVVVWLT